MADSLGNRPTVWLLGQMRVGTDDQSTPIRGAKQRILLAHLVMSNGKPVAISRLTSDLWGGTPGPTSPHALQEHVSRLRTVLGVEIVLVEGVGYSLSPELIDTDVRRFLQLYEQGRAQFTGGDARGALHVMQAALDLWQGPFLEDLADIDGLRSYKLHLDKMARQLASDRIDAHLECGLGEEVLTDIRAAVERDPLWEHGWYQLMRALDQAGRRTEALQTFHDARELFIDVLGVEPSAALADLHVQLLRAADHRPPPAGPAEARPTLTQVTRASALIGRNYEVKALERMWQQAREGLHVVAITGEPGVGKSRLAHEFAVMAARHGALILRGDCQPGTAVRYQPFTHILHASLDFAHEHGIAATMSRHLAGLTRVLPAMSDLGTTPPPAPGMGSGDDIQSMDAIAAWLEALSHVRPVAITLEDFHWADEQSVLTLRHLLRSTRTIKGAIIVTIRDQGREAPDVTSSSLSQLLAHSNGISHLPLRKLNPQETADLVNVEASHTGFAPFPDWAHTYVRSASGGNPLFTIELTRHLLATGALEDGSIPAPPANLRQVIEGHLSTLARGASSLLTTAAAIGTEFDLATVTKVTTLSTAQVDALLQQAVTSRLVEQMPDGPGRFRFSHDVVRTVLYESIPPLERASLHSSIARVLGESPVKSRARHLRELAHHQQLSDIPDGKRRAAINLKMAGHDALDHGAPAEAIALFTQSLELLSDTADAGVTCDILLGLGAAQLRNAVPQYRATLLRAARVAIEINDSTRLISAVLLNSRGWWSNSAHIDHERVETIEAALAACPREDRIAYCQLLAAWALENVRDQGSRHEVLARSAQSLDIADEIGDVQALHTALAARFAVKYALFEGPAECVTLGRRLLELGQSQADRMMALSGLLCLGQASMRFGDYHVADRCVEHAQQLARTLHHPPRLWLAQGWAAMREASRGRFESAHALATETYELGLRTGQADAATWYMGQVYTFRMMQGSLAEIVTTVGEHVDEVADAIPAWRAALALALAHAGETGPAEDILADFAASNFEQLPRDILWLNGMGYLAMASAAVGRQDIAAQLYDRLLPYAGMVATNGTIDAGPVDLHLGLLTQTQGNAEAAARHFQSAAILSRKVGATVWAAQAQQSLHTVSSIS